MASVIVFSLNSWAYAAEVSLAWSPVALNEDGSVLTDLAGYRLHYGISSRAYSSSIEAGTATTAAAPGLDDGITYYFAVTAYSTTGRESAYSSEAAWSSPDITPPSITCPATVSITADLFGTADAPDLRSSAVVNDNITATADIQITQSPTPGGTIGIGTTVATLTALDEAGNSSDCTVDIIVAAAPPLADETAPTVRITAPTARSSFSATDLTVTIAGTAADDTAVTAVRYSASTGADGACTGTESWSAGAQELSSGDNVFTVTASDAAGNTGSDSITIRLPSYLTIERPTADTTAYAGGSLMVEWLGFAVPGSMDIVLRDETAQVAVLTNSMPVAAAEDSVLLLIPRSVKRGSYRIAASYSDSTGDAVLSPLFSILRNQRPTLGWDNVPGATAYELWLNRNGQTHYTQTLVQKNNSWTPWQKLPDGTYEWWTRAYVPNSKRMKWVNEGTFTIPYAEDPLRPTFDWNAVENTTWYQLWISTGGNMYMEPWLKQTRTTWKPATNVPAGTYQWWARSYAPKTGSAKWVHQGAITVPNVPNPLRPILKWDPVTTATWYQLWLATADKVHAKPWLEQTRTTWQPETNLPANTYQWWTRSYSKEAGFGKWIDQGVFIIPVEHATVRPTFAWDTVRKATWYRIQLVLDGEVFYDEWLAQTGNTWTPDTTLPEGKYEWRVDAYISGSESTGWAEMGSFEVP